MPTARTADRLMPRWASLASRRPLVGPGTRLVFLGDSITQQGMYTAYVEDWLALRHPGRLLTCYNAGWAGDTVQGANLRFDRDIAPLRPTVVTVCLGMNDGAYAAPDPGRTGRFAAGLVRLVERIRALGAAPVLMTPGMSDDRKQPAWSVIAYNHRGLRILARSVLKIARRLRVPAVDVHALMNAVAARGRRTDDRFTLAPDGNHPDAGGHLVMAMGLLCALGERPAYPATVLLGGGRCDRHLFAVPEAAHVLRHLPAAARPADPVVHPSTIPDGRLALHQPDGRILPVDRRALRRGLAMRLVDGCSTGPGAAQIKAAGAAGRAAWRIGWRDIALGGRWGFDGDMEAPCDAAAIRHAADLAGRAARVRQQAAAPCFILPLSAMPDGQTLADRDLIRLWAVCGPCAGPFQADGLQSYGGERAAMRIGRLPGRTAWSRLLVRAGDEADCLGRRFGPCLSCSAYLAVDITVAAPQQAWLGLGSDDGFAVWCNGRLLGRNLDVMRGSVPDSERFPIRLRAGRNRLLLKVTQHAGSWGFHLRLDGLRATARATWPL